MQNLIRYRAIVLFLCLQLLILFLYWAVFGTGAAYILGFMFAAVPDNTSTPLIVLRIAACIICYILVPIAALSRVLLIGKVYNYAERYSKDELVQKFINNLKHNKKFRMKFLFVIEAPLLLYIIISVIKSANLIDGLLMLGYYTIHCDLFFAYILLFAWIKNREFIKRFITKLFAKEIMKNMCL